MSDKNTRSEYIPRFHLAYLHPRHWLSWLVVALIAALALLPVGLRDPLLARTGRLAARLGKKARRRALINLHYCLPELSETQRVVLVEQMFSTAAQAIVLMAELALFSPKRLRSRIHWHNEHIIEQMRREQQNVILLVPHGWALDIPAMLLSASGQKIAGMFHNQSDVVLDYMWNRMRLRFGGRLHARNDGIKPFIQSVRQGYWGYYLPDEDYGEEHSYFVDFFATYKATLPVIGRMMKVCRARVVPLFPVYDANTHQLHIHIRPVMDDLVSYDDAGMARRMNEEVEQLVRPNPEQYTWLLKLLRTRRQGETEPYQREDLY